LLEQLTATQLAEWEVFIENEQIRPIKEDFRLAYGLSVITNLFISAFGKTGSKTAKIEEFLIDWWNDKGKGEEQTIEQMKAFMLDFAKKQNKKVEELESVKRKK